MTQVQEEIKGKYGFYRDVSILGLSCLCSLSTGCVGKKFKGTFTSLL